jgi:hypothetical protein
MMMMTVTSSTGAQQTHRIFYDFQRMGEKHEDEWEVTERMWSESKKEYERMEEVVF